MMLVWKLLRRHISIAQLLGFFVANMVGMLIVLLSIQFYADVFPILTGDNGIGSNDYLVVSKQVKAGLGTGSVGEFGHEEIEELQKQPFCMALGAFTPSRYEVRAGLNVAGIASFSTDMFFEAVPDEFVETPPADWRFETEEDEVPIILPRDYLALYNFGFAQTRQLPKLTPDVIKMITIRLRLKGVSGERWLNGRVVGFGSRMNTILVPQSFIDWSNQTLASGSAKQPTRLIMKVANTADDRIPAYLSQKGWELQDDKANQGRMVFVLRVVSGVVLAVGLTISLLSLYILMLSIYLLVQKNTDKLQNLLLIGYSIPQVCRPYQILATVLNIGVALLALCMLFALRAYYLDLLGTMFPDVTGGQVWPVIVMAMLLLVLVTMVNSWVIRRKIKAIPS